MGFNLDEYEPVASRIENFYKDHADGRIVTKIVSTDGDYVMGAAVYKTGEDLKNQLPWATGYAQEIPGKGMVNSTSALENCETSAIGRALANAGYATKNRASREEMEKVERHKQAPSVRASADVKPSSSNASSVDCEHTNKEIRTSNSEKNPGRAYQYCKDCKSFVKWVALGESTAADGEQDIAGFANDLWGAKVE